MLEVADAGGGIALRECGGARRTIAEWRCVRAQEGALTKIRRYPTRCNFPECGCTGWIIARREKRLVALRTLWRPNAILQGDNLGDAVLGVALIVVKARLIHAAAYGRLMAWVGLTIARPAIQHVGAIGLLAGCEVLS